MPVALNYQTLTANGFIRVDWFASNAFASFMSPTVAELNAGLNISPAVSWTSFAFKRAASTTTSDPSLADSSEVKDRGIINFGGDMHFYFPGPQSTATDVYSQAFALFNQPRVFGFIVIRMDGNKPYNQPYAANDIVSVYQVETDAQMNTITGEAAFTYGVTFLGQGAAAMDTIVKTATNTLAITPATLSLVHGTGKSRLAATINTRPYTNGVAWSSSAPAIATVSDAGVVTALTAGSATITATYPYDALATSTCVVTVT
jgi:hypothetical protein